MGWPEKNEESVGIVESWGRRCFKRERVVNRCQMLQRCQVKSQCLLVKNEEIIEEFQWELGGYLDVTFHYYFSLSSLVSRKK